MTVSTNFLSFFFSCGPPQGRNCQPNGRNNSVHVCELDRETTYLNCVEQALHNIATSPIYTMRKTGRAPAVVTCAETTPVSSAFIPLQETMKTLFSQSVLTEQERETLFSKVHAIRLNNQFRDSVISGFTCETDVVDKIVFYQCVIRELVTCLLASYREGLAQTVAR